MPFRAAIAFFAAFAVALVVTPLVRAVAWRVGAVDRPDGERKTHGRDVALLGGVAVFIAICAAIVAAVATGLLPGEHIKGKHLLGIIAAAGLLAIGGALDDRLNLKPRWQILWPILAVCAIVASGIGIVIVTNPFGGILRLDRVMTTLFWLDGIPYRVTLVADLIAAAWLMGLTYTTKFLDGLDGLVSGMAVIGGLVIAAVSVMQDVTQADTAVVALIVAGAYAGFLKWNASPASIFLGEGGATMAGFLLGVLAIISGAKIATTLLVLGLPLFDAALVIARRVFVDKKSPAVGDRSHLHFRLLDSGWSPRQVTLFYWLVAAGFGTTTLFLRTWGKLAALAGVVAVLLALTAVATAAYRKKV